MHGYMAKMGETELEFWLMRNFCFLTNHGNQIHACQRHIKTFHWSVHLALFRQALVRFTYSLSKPLFHILLKATKS